ELKETVPEEITCWETGDDTVTPKFEIDPTQAPTEKASPLAWKTTAYETVKSRLRRSTIAIILVFLTSAAVVGWYLKRGEIQKPVPAFQDAIAQETLSFGIARFLSHKELREEYAPLVKYLAERLGQQVKLEILENYVNLPDQLASGKLQFAALSAANYVQAKRETPSIKLLATHVTAGGSSYEGHIITRADSGIQKITDLKNKIFCYVSEHSASGYLYPRAIFRRNGMDPDNAFKATRFTPDHPSALHALNSGACDGAAVFAGMLYEAKKHNLAPETFHILASTDRIPYDAYCASPLLGTKEITTLRRALLELRPGSPIAKNVLGKNNRITGFIAVDDNAYKSVREIERFLDPTSVKEKR
ncbi:MAG: phosphate/phosphite/phosphonate ABC transporter substrate-binding protein, partial [Pseudomonadota bacterium]